jgi:hypothetical protein
VPGPASAGTPSASGGFSPGPGAVTGPGERVAGSLAPQAADSLVDLQRKRAELAALLAALRAQTEALESQARDAANAR